MTAGEQAVKMLMIRGLQADELAGYEASARARGFFDGEQGNAVSMLSTKPVRSGQPWSR